VIPGFQRTVWNSLRAALGVLAVAALLLPSQAQTASAEPAALGNQMVESVNQVRAEHGICPLAEDGSLDELAFERSADMAARGYFSHTTPEGLDVFAMMDQRGIGYYTAGENLAWNTHGDANAGPAALQSLLNSPPHRANLLNPAFSQIGVGVARDGGKVYFTLVFVG
jgi:uncharacterized protein YkwD